MAKPDKSKDNRPKARLPKGMRDVGPAEVRALDAMLAKICGVYELYGFEPLATSALEFSDALGKFLPDQERPNAGVFSFQDEDGDWMSLRYDLTAPLARYVAENFDALPKPYRRYQTGSVWRNEKPGPGRFREFVQFDADIVGTENVAADAEICMMAADALEALGLGGQYVIKVSNRKVLDGIRDAIGLIDSANDARWLTIVRAMDKYDRLAREGVAALLGEGRIDESGDRTDGAKLDAETVKRLVQVLSLRLPTDLQTRSKDQRPYNPYISTGPDVDQLVPRTLTSLIAKVMGDYSERVHHRDRLELKILASGLKELEDMGTIFAAAGYDRNQIIIDPSVVRGLEYYTGPVFEAELTFDTAGDDGKPVRFGSVGGGGRYDGLVERFRGEKVPATGFSIGVSRLYAALQALGKTGAEQAHGPVLVLVMDKDRVGDYQAMAARLRAAGIPAEMYVGTSGMKAQMKYADKRGSPCVVIQGGDEKAKGEVTIKDLIEGAKAAAAIKDRAEWTEGRPAQIAVPEADLVTAVKEILARHRA